MSMMIINPFVFGRFTPASVPGLLLWLKAGEIAAADGDTLSQWDDLSGQGNHVSQATAGARPTYKTNVLNGKPIVRFDGGDWLSKTAFPAPQQFTVFAVVKHTGASLVHLIHTDNSPRHCQFRYNSASATPAECIAFNTGGGVAGTDSQAVTPGSWNIVAAVRSASAVQVYVNGASNGPTATTGTPQSGTPTLTVGANQLGGAAVTGDFAEVVYCGSALDVNTFANVLGYLSQEYGITV